MKGIPGPLKGPLSVASSLFDPVTFTKPRIYSIPRNTGLPAIVPNFTTKRELCSRNVFNLSGSRVMLRNEEIGSERSYVLSLYPRSSRRALSARRFLTNLFASTIIFSASTTGSALTSFLSANDCRLSPRERDFTPTVSN